jgi:hypothetical protein
LAALGQGESKDLLLFPHCPGIRRQATQPDIAGTIKVLRYGLGFPYTVFPVKVLR